MPGSSASAEFGAEMVLALEIGGEFADGVVFERDLHDVEVAVIRVVARAPLDHLRHGVIECGEHHGLSDFVRI